MLIELSLVVLLALLNGFFALSEMALMVARKSRLKHLAPMFEAAIERGELPADVDREELFALAAGPIYFRTYISAQPYDEDWIMTIVDRVCSNYGLPK